MPAYPEPASSPPSIGATGVACSAGIVVATIAWTVSTRPLASVVAGLATFAAIWAASKRMAISLVPSAAIAGTAAEEEARYSGPPGELPMSLQRGRPPRRRAKIQSAGAAVLILCALILGGGFLMLPTIALVYVAREIYGAQVCARVSGVDASLAGPFLVQQLPSGADGSRIDLRWPFTYEYLFKDDCSAVYRLRQGKSTLDLPSAAQAAPWVARDVLGVEWPPRNKPAYHPGI